jgi:formylglycine-generating enzyme required for sulfatase activity
MGHSAPIPTGWAAFVSPKRQRGGGGPNVSAQHALKRRQPQLLLTGSKGKAKVANVTDADLKRFPLESVSWDDVQRFLKKLNAREKGKGWTYRLPTEAEWEFACRNAATDKAECSFNFYFAKGTNSLSSKEANINRARPIKVGSCAPNKLGLYDMHGNVAQWCDDLWSAAEPDLGRVTRGGSWHSTFVGRYCEAGRRMVLGQSDRYFLQGFRVARVRSKRK